MPCFHIDIITYPYPELLFQLMPYLKCFMKDAPVQFKESYVAYAKKILGRTLLNGVRYHPPNWLEYQVRILAGIGNYTP